VLDLEPGLSLAEIARLARAFARNGVTQVRLAGGEPLLRRGVIDIVETFARQPGIGLVAMTTDGVRLAEYAEPLLWAGLQRITLTLDSLSRDTYHHLTGQDALPRVLLGLEVARRLPFQYLCVSLTARRGRNDGELPAFVALARTGLALRISELPRTEADWEAQFLPAREVRARLAELGVERPAGRRAVRLPGGGSVEVLAPVSEPSAARALHLRVNAIGRLTACKWQTEAEEEDLRPWLQAPDLEARVAEAVDRAARQAESAEDPRRVSTATSAPSA
jgi:cyclic pyranopterin phosphate synthase